MWWEFLGSDQDHLFGDIQQHPDEIISTHLKLMNVEKKYIDMAQHLS